MRSDPRRIVTAFDGLVFPGGAAAYFSPDGQNLEGGGKTVDLRLKKSRVAAITRVGDGLLTGFYQPSSQAPAGVFFSPGGHNPGGGGATVPAAP